MRIAIDVIPTRTDGSTGGAWNSLIGLLDGFSKDSENKYFILTAHWNHEYYTKYESLGMKCICIIKDDVPSTKRHHNLFVFIEKVIIRVFKKSPRLLHRLNIDLLFCPMTAPTYAEHGIKTVCIVNDIQHEYYEQFFTSSELGHRRVFYRDVCRKADAVVCISEYTKNSFLSKYDYPSKNAHVVHIAIQNRFNRQEVENKEDVLLKYGLVNISYAYYPANFWQHKNHRMLLTAFNQYLHANPSSGLNLVLTGCVLDNDLVIKDSLTKMGLESRVHTLGYISENHLSVILKNCSFVIFPSLFEGFGIPVLEAMQCGKPVLCSNVTSLPEVGGNAAIYFDPRKPDSILEAIDKLEHTDRQQLSLISKQHLNNFSEDEMIRSYLRIFRETVGNSSGILHYEIHGLYPDHFSKEKFSIYIDRQSGSITFEFSLSGIPTYNHSDVIISIDGNKTKHRVIKGENKNVTLVLEEAQEIHGFITSCFCPTDYNIPDDRNLGVLVHKIVVTDKNGVSTVLFE